MRPKDQPHRDRKLLDLAHRIQWCTVQIPDHCIGFQEHGCEPSHDDSQFAGKATAQKSHDCLCAAACHPCHMALPRLSRVDREFYQTRGMMRTIVEYFRRGWVVVR